MPARQPVSGSATHYALTTIGKCSFDVSATIGDELIAAVSSADYVDGTWCGACLVVVGPDDEILVRVVDSCPGCQPNDLDLSREAFAMLAPLAKGRIPITWFPVPCDVEGSLAYRFKEKSNAHWTAIQVRNHRYPIATVEARKATTFEPLSRAAYNYFVGKGLGPGPYTLRVTDTRGNVVEDANIALGDAVTRTGSTQLARCQ